MSKKDATEVVELDRQAVAWHNLLQSGEASEQQLAAYIEWLRASPQHEAAMAETETAWDLLNDLEHDNDVAGLLDKIEPAAYDGPIPGRPARRVRQRWLAAAVALLVLTSGVLFYSRTPDHQVESLRYVTALGEQESHRLADGSQVTLNTATEILVQYSGDERRIYLQRGEALFDVAPDTTRPFTVVTDHGATRALGTLFNVYVRPQDVEVSLLEGKVQVAAAGSAADAGSQRLLAPGEQIRYRADGTFSPIRTVTADQVLLWTSRKLNFKQTRLVDAVAEINRYSARKLVIQDPAINDINISLRIGVDNIESFLKVSEELFGIKAEYQFGRVLLSQAENR